VSGATPTHVLLAALSVWVKSALGQLDRARLRALHECLDMEGADLRIVISLHERSITVEAWKHEDESRCLELYREDLSG
jgi:hypothetical protein